MSILKPRKKKKSEFPKECPHRMKRKMDMDAAGRNNKGENIFLSMKVQTSCEDHRRQFDRRLLGLNPPFLISLHKPNKSTEYRILTVVLSN